MADKYRGNYQKLQDHVLLTGVVGTWNDKGNQKEYRTEDGAILNWWESSKTIQFQGPKDLAEEFKAKFESVDSGDKASHAAPTATVDETKIFIVHGHDTVALEQLELVLRRLDLNPYILQNNDGESRTLIEALEQQIYDRSAFGIILTTPDDYGYRKDQDDTEREPRPRQNVILEMGMVMASLGRERMVILKKGNLEMPSDVNGVIYLEFNEHVKEVAGKLAQRIKNAGIQIDDAKITAAMS